MMIKISHLIARQISRKMQLWSHQLIDFCKARPLLAVANLLFLIFNFALLIRPYWVEQILPPVPEPPQAGSSKPQDIPAKETGKTAEGRLWSGASMESLLQKSGLSPIQVQQILSSVRQVFDPRKLRAGNLYSLRWNESGDLEKLRYDIDSDRYLQIEKSSQGWVPVIQKNPLDLRTESISVPIEDNLFNALVQSGEKDILAMKLSDIFQWDIDFNTDFRRGDQFRFLVEKYYLKNDLIRYGEILSAELQNQGKKIRAFRYTVPGRPADYFDAEGRPLRKQMLKSPLPFVAPITSRFSRSRFHPILKVYRPHMGIDYGAPEGTSVLSMADGTVSAVGWDNGGGGNMVRINHAGGMTTLYMHLSRFASGLQVGQAVHQGQLIGYVGATGLATGPHLDFRIQKGKQFVNPIKIHGAPSDPLKATLLAAFFQERDSLLHQLDFGVEPIQTAQASVKP